MGLFKQHEEDYGMIMDESIDYDVYLMNPYVEQQFRNIIKALEYFISHLLKKIVLYYVT